MLRSQGSSTGIERGRRIKQNAAEGVATKEILDGDHPRRIVDVTRVEVPGGIGLLPQQPSAPWDENTYRKVIPSHKSAADVAYRLRRP